MRSMREWILRLIGTVRRRRTDADLQDELRAHLDLAAGDARRRHRADSGAERDARLRAGGVSQAMDALRDQRGLPWLDAMAADLAGRSQARSFTRQTWMRSSRRFAKRWPTLCPGQPG